MLILFQQSHFLNEIISNTLSFEHVVLGVNGKLQKKKNIFMIKLLLTFITIRMT